MCIRDRATTPHRLRNDGPEPATAIWCILGRDTPFSDT